MVEHFRTLEDPRIERTKKHNLLAILVMALCMLLSGGEGFQDMALFGQSKRAWLQTFLTLPHGIPSHDTCGRGFARLHPQRFQACFLAWTQAVAPFTQVALLSLDGKTVQASFDRATASSPLHMLSAWCADNGGRVVGPIKTDTKSHAITALPALLHLLALQGCLVTMHTCIRTSHTIWLGVTPSIALMPLITRMAARYAEECGPCQPCQPCLRSRNGLVSNRSLPWQRFGWRTSMRPSPVPPAAPFPVWRDLPPPALR